MVIQSLAGDLQITKSISGDIPSLSGDTVSYTIEVVNIGDIEATTVTVTDILPDELTYVSATPEPDVFGQTLIWGLGDMPVGSGQEITLETTLGDVDADTEVSNTATVNTLITDENDDNDDDTVTFSVGADGVDLALTKSISVDTITNTTDEQFTYTLEIENRGTEDVDTYTVQDAIPTGLSYISASVTPFAIGDENIVWNISDTISPGDTATIDIVVSLPTVLSQSTLDNTATVTATNDVVTSNDSDTISTTLNAACGNGEIDTHLGETCDIDDDGTVV